MTQRLGVGVAIGTFWGPMIAIAMLANFISSMKALYIIAFLLILSVSVLLAFACIKKFHSTYKTIVERNDEYNSFFAETNKFVEKFSQEIDNNIECDKDNDKIKVTNKTNSEQKIKKQIKIKTEKHFITAKKNKRKE